MGLALLANLSAFDFGYLSAGQIVERTAKAFHAMEALERYQGHFYNWYDTQSLKPLPPPYISSVDSGNLAGHLLTLRPGLQGLTDHKILEARFFDGLSDTLRIVVEAAAAAPVVWAPAPHLAQLQRDLESAIRSQPATLAAARLCLDRLATSAAVVVADVEALDADHDSQLVSWARAFASQCRDAIDELTFLAPWAGLMSSTNRLVEFSDLDKIPTMGEVAALEGERLPAIVRRLGSAANAAESVWLGDLELFVKEGSLHARTRMAAIKELCLQCEALASMEWGFLFDRTRHLFSIGYHVDEHRRDSGYYDLLASEARFSNFVAIAQGQLPQDSWFALGRLLTTAGGEPVLLSWSGSMFEYLMPLLVMPNYEHTLLDQTFKVAVARQIEYGRKRGVPWGISECGYNAIDAHFNYQYRAFGVPGLGLKRGLSEDLVIAPYASALALMVAPEEACLNLERLAAEGFEARYGFYEAIDYTPSRLPRGQSSTRWSGPSWPITRAWASCPWPICCWAARCRRDSLPIRCSRRRYCCCKNGFPRRKRSTRTPRNSSTIMPFPSLRRRRFASLKVPTPRTRRCSCSQTAGTT